MIKIQIQAAASGEHVYPRDGYDTHPQVRFCVVMLEVGWDRGEDEGQTKMKTWLDVQM